MNKNFILLIIACIFLTSSCTASVKNNSNSDNSTNAVKSSDANISALTLSDVDPSTPFNFSPTAYNYPGIKTASVYTVSLSFTLDNSKATAQSVTWVTHGFTNYAYLTPAGSVYSVPLNGGEWRDITITVKAEDGTIKQYTIIAVVNT